MRELVSEIDLGELDANSVDELRKLVDKFKGDAEINYRDGRWTFRVFRSVEVPPAKPTKPPKAKRVYKKAAPPRKFIEDAVKEAVRKDSGMLDKPIEVMKIVRDRAREKGYRATIAPGLVKLTLRRLKKT
ncbi:MAG: hypothetical protein GTN76_17090 [Candidatus Aenigmarchaeota archaeon]|nr:hypothetical protein [Candidatus Aenigmarchaeota archaeon]